MSEIIILAIKAKHFKDTFYKSCRYDPIANAAKDYFGAGDAYENLDELSVWKRRYSHIAYTKQDYRKDHALASAAGYDDSIIFNLELKEVV